MPIYKVGDVVWCKFPFEDDPTKFKQRPGLIVNVTTVGSSTYYHMAKITSATSNDIGHVGRIVKSFSKAGKDMNLVSDSFIHLDKIARLRDFAIIRLHGVCPIMPELIAICTAKGILL